MTNETIWRYTDILDVNSQKSFAIIILNQPILTNPDLIKSLWEKAVVRIAVDGGANRWLQFIEKNSLQSLSSPDCITGDFDSINDTTEKYFRERGVIFVPTPDQDDTDFTKSLRQLNSIVVEKCLKLHHVLAVCTNSGRVDQIMANLETLHVAKTILNNISVILMSSNSLTWLLQQGNHSIHVPEEFISKGHYVGLIPLRGPTIVTTSGLVWNLENTRLGFGGLVSTSNAFKSSLVTIACDQDLLWTATFTLDST